MCRCSRARFETLIVAKPKSNCTDANQKQIKRKNTSAKQTTSNPQATQQGISSAMSLYLPCNLLDLNFKHGTRQNEQPPHCPVPVHCLSVSRGIRCPSAHLASHLALAFGYAFGENSKPKEPGLVWSKQKQPSVRVSSWSNSAPIDYSRDPSGTGSIVGLHRWISSSSG